MSTDQITDEHGNICYHDNYIPIPEGYDVCDRCQNLTKKEDCIYFYSLRLKLNKQQKRGSVVCEECWNRYYDFYRTEFHIIRERGTKPKKYFQNKNRFQRYNQSEIVCINLQEYKGMGEVVSDCQNYCVIKLINKKEIKVSKNNITKMTYMT